MSEKLKESLQDALRAKAKTFWYCEDCGYYLFDVGNHNANHSIKSKKIVLLSDAEAEIQRIKDEAQKAIEVRNDELRNYINMVEAAKTKLTRYLWLKLYSDPQTNNDVITEEGEMEQLEKGLIKLFAIVFEGKQSAQNSG